MGLAPNVRICKGIYPETALTSYTDPEAIRRNFVFCLDTLLRTESYAAIATHDEALIVGSLERLDRYRRPRDSYEFQTLLGVRPDLARSLARAGHRVRVYVPYGADWRRYATRRLRESPHVPGYITRDLLGRVGSSVGTRTCGR